MTTSILTTKFDDLVSGLIARLVTAGYPYDPTVTNLEVYLATVLAGLTGGDANLYLTRGGPRVLADILTALGGSGDALATTELQLMADIIDQ